MDDFENREFSGAQNAAEPAEAPKAEETNTDGFFESAFEAEPAAEPAEPDAAEEQAAEPVTAEPDEGAEAQPAQEEPSQPAQEEPSQAAQEEPRQEPSQAGQQSAQNGGYQQANGYYGQAGGTYQAPPYNNQQTYSQTGANPYSSGYRYSAPNGYQQQGGYYQQGGYQQNGYQQSNYQQGGYQQTGYAQGGYQQPGYQQYGYRPAQTVTEPAAEPANKGTGKKIFFILIGLVLVAAIIGCSVMLKNFSEKRKAGGNAIASHEEIEEEEQTSNNVNIAVVPAKSDSKALTVEKIAEKARESCVGVLVYANSNSAKEAGQGTGIIAKEDAKNKCTYILTCAHVIDDGGVSVKIQMENGTVFDAEIVAFDVRTDVGVVKVNQTGLNIADFGDDTQLKVGSAVYAVGNPGGVEFFGSFTDGIVSAIDRPIDSEIGYTMKCIQHTAAINPGNSGGALVNVYGQVVGINSQKIASADYEGMGFAIPITQALKIAEDLINYKYVPNRAKLGITYYSLSASQQYSMIAQINQLPAGTLIINTISDDSSLANSNAQEYDMIIAVDGKELTTADILLEKIDKGKVGDKMKLTLCRVNSNYTLEKFDVVVTLVEDKGDTRQETTTASPFYPFGDGFEFNFGN